MVLAAVSVVSGKERHGCRFLGARDSIPESLTQTNFVILFTVQRSAIEFTAAGPLHGKKTTIKFIFRPRTTFV